jgi:hypothetical protein
MSDAILYIDTSEVREGRLEELKVAIDELVEFIDANVPRAITYDIYLNEDGSRMTVAQIHPDSASLEFHMQVGGPAFRKMANLVELLTIEVYGKPSENLLKQLREKARMLGNGTVTVHERRAGFARFGPLSEQAD